MNLENHVVRTREVIAIFFLYFAVALIINQPGFHSPMIYDSEALIEHKAALFANGLPEVLGIVPARPLFMTSLYANYKLAGMDPYFFRVFNAAILGAAGAALAMMLLLILRLQGQTDSQTGGRTRAVAAVLGLLFVVHPLQTFVVLYIWQREAILACFFYFSAIAAYLSVRSGRLPRTAPGLVLVGCLFLAGLLTKENLITLPLTLVLTELILFKRSRKGLAEKAIGIGAVTVPPLLIYLFLTWSLHAPDSRHAEGIVNRLLVHYSLGDLTFFQVVLTESRVLFSYLFSILAPFWGPPQLIEAQIISISPWNPPTTPAACAGVILLLYLAVRYRRERPVEAFGVMFYFLALMPEALLIPQYLFFGYRPILPMAGVLLIFGQALLALLRMWDKKWAVYRMSVVAACLLLTTLFALQTFRQAIRWNPVDFWRSEYSRLPSFSEQVEQKPYWDVVTNYSEGLLKRGKYLESIDVMKRHLALSPEMEPVMAALGEPPGKATSAPTTGTATRMAGPKVPTALLVNLGLALKQSGRIPEATIIYAILHNDLGMAFQQSGDVARAVEQYRLAIALRPEFPEALYNLGNSLRDVGDHAQSAENLGRALALRPNYAQAIQSLGYTLVMSGRLDEAIVNFEKVLTLDPRNAEVHNALGLVLAKRGEIEQARAHFRAALDIDPRNSDVRHNLESLPQNAVP